MKFIIKLFPEITIKSQSVRLRFIKMLTGNIRNVLKHYDETLAVVRHWDNIEVRAKDENQRLAIRDALTRIPGIHHILEVEDVPFTDMHDIFEKALVQYRDQLEGKTFCVRVKRRGKHEFSSIDVERYVGGGLNQHIESARVKLTNPDVTVHLEVEDDRLLLIKGRYEGIGGFPIGTQEDVLSLISGGFDSGVSSYMLMRRGCRVHYCFFNLGGAAHEIGVRQVAHYLWNRFGSSHRVRFVAINFEPVVGEILEKVDDGQMGVVLKRMMVRAASKVAERYGVQALVTGEALGQVSSQTLTNLRLIDNVSDTLILRPLISYDKEHIINLARQIDDVLFIVRDQRTQNQRIGDVIDQTQVGQRLAGDLSQRFAGDQRLHAIALRHFRRRTNHHTFQYHAHLPVIHFLEDLADHRFKVDSDKTHAMRTAEAVPQIVRHLTNADFMGRAAEVKETVVNAAATTHQHIAGNAGVEAAGDQRQYVFLGPDRETADPFVTAFDQQQTIIFHFQMHSNVWIGQLHARRFNMLI